MTAKAPTIPPHLAHRPVHRGLVVPWVAVWSAERHLTPQVRVHPTLGVIGGQYTRTSWGMACIEIGNMLAGAGVPDFGSTSSGRQRRCMTMRQRGVRCQVCGGWTGPLPWWIIPPLGPTEERLPLSKLLPEQAALGELTKHPGLCGPCAHVAEQWCPHLRRVEYRRFQATPVPVAMMGDLLDSSGAKVEAVVTPLDDPDRVFVLGRELIVRLELPT